MNTGKMIFWLCAILVLAAVALYNTGCAISGPNSFDASVKRVLGQEDAPPSLNECLNIVEEVEEINQKITELEKKMRAEKSGPKQAIIAQQLADAYLQLLIVEPDERFACGGK